MKVRGTQKIVKTVEVNVDTVYVRTNIERVDTEDFVGWEYDEEQFKKDEYTELLQNQINVEKGLNAFMGMQLVEKDVQVMGLQNSNELLGSQVVQMDIRLMMGGV